MKTFIALFDLHYGYERTQSRHKKPLHDRRCMNIAGEFIEDTKPDVIILGGDILDCGPISSHRKREGSGKIEGLRILSDAKELRQKLLDPLERTGADLVYITGNHEAWLNQLVDEEPGLAGIVDLKAILGLDRWKVIPQGGHYNLGKLTFIHGDQIKGGEYAAKKAVTDYERSVRLGHFHTMQTFSKTSALDIKQVKTGMVVPCLSTKAPSWVKGAPNKWCQGFLFGYIQSNGMYNDYPVIITQGQAIVHGKKYTG